MENGKRRRSVTQGLVKYAQEFSHVREKVWNDPSGIDDVTRVVGMIH
jgi:hypothetical protein